MIFDELLSAFFLLLATTSMSRVGGVNNPPSTHHQVMGNSEAHQGAGTENIMHTLCQNHSFYICEIVGIRRNLDELTFWALSWTFSVDNNSAR